jgi:hypothetical protein
LRVSPIYPAIALISAAALAFEIFLMRIFSIVQWHHYAYMIISVALLGFGASGTWVALRYVRGGVAPATPIVFHAAGFALSMPLSVFAAEIIPFNALEIVWNHRQWLHLAGIYVLALVPFWFASNAICVALASRRWPVARIYASDLAGAAAGAGLAVALLWWLPPAVTPYAASAAALAGALFAWAAVRPLERPGRIALAAAAVALFVLLVGAARTPLQPNPYKQLPQTLRIAGTEVVATRYSPLGQIDVVASPQIPFRHVPGLSLANVDEPPEQLGLFTDADALSAITRGEGGRGAHAYLEYVPAALPYELRERPRVLVIGVGGGEPVLRALHYGAAAIDAVELNPRIVELLRGPYREFSGAPLDRSVVDVHLEEGRSFIARSAAQYDLIEIAMAASSGSSGAGLQAVGEDYLHTIEAVGEYLRRLAPGGLLAMPRWARIPPRDGVKLFATLIEALEAADLDPASALVWLRGWQTQLLLAKRGAFTPAEIEEILAFCESRWFDVAWVPGGRQIDPNRFNLLPGPYFREAALALLGPERDAFIERYKFDVRPATDDRPYFHHFFRWRSFEELRAMPAQQGWAFVDLAYPILLATLVQAVLAALAFVIAPLLVFRRRLRGTMSIGLGAACPVGLYFVAVGFGFMFIEVAAIQKFTLYVGHPVYAASTVLVGFLVFAGAGSATLGHWGRGARRSRVTMVIGGIALLAVLLWELLPGVLGATLAAPLGVRVALTLALIAPLALVMGTPLSAALGRIEQAGAGLIAWSWGVNGSASVIGAVAATLVALHWGSSAVILIGAAMYATAAGLLFGSSVLGQPSSDFARSDSLR